MASPVCLLVTRGFCAPQGQAAVERPQPTVLPTHAYTEESAAPVFTGKFLSFSCVGSDALLLYPEGVFKKHSVQIISKSNYFNDRANYRTTRQ